MPELTGSIKLLTQAVFYIVIPLAALFFRFKKKISTGFAAGIILSSFMLGLLTVATVVRVDQVDAFMREVNYKNYEEAKRSYKILIQSGPQYLEKIKYDEIIDQAFFERIKKDIASEYEDVARRYYSEYSLAPDADCSAVSSEEEKLNNLKHAYKLLDLSNSIGIRHEDLEKKLADKITESESIHSRLKDRCSK